MPENHGKCIMHMKCPARGAATPLPLALRRSCTAREIILKSIIFLPIKLRMLNIVNFDVNYNGT